MFNIGASELILILLIAFIVVGPKDLPKIARFLGRMVRKARTLLKEIKQETGMDEVESEIRETQREVQKTIREADIREDLKVTKKELDGELTQVGKEADLSAELRQTKKELNQTLHAGKK